ncbi:MAG: porin [Lentimicrobium sp.]|jgi:phosphate-selective porin OprO/OprP|nr:porin [Lentimicrobium sp.]MDD2528439.1 porin [Lentimicrobiaceae bacterium]MDD4599126.1 porin [Lentimicrobiaceae bacterium]HAH59919.1 porin [Bacteroidales bacterium]
MRRSGKLKLTVTLMALLFACNHVFPQETDTAVRYNQYGVKVNRNALQAEERNGILILESKDQKYKIWYDARVQVDGAYFPGNPLNPIGNGLSIRRARFAVKSQFTEKWYGEFDMDISNSELELKDAYLEYSPSKHLGIKIGNFKEGFSMERTTTSRYLPFIERPNAVATFAPSRHIGIAATYSKKWLFGMGGIHFQDIGDLEERTFSKDNNKDYGVDEGVSFTGKLVGMPFYDDLTKGLHLGLAGSYRTPKSHAEIRGTERYSTRSLTSINRKKYMDTDIIPNVDHITLANFELAGYYKNFRFQSEYVLSNVHKKNDLPTEQFDGWYVYGSVLLFGGNFNYNTSEAEFTQLTRGKEWGDVELLVRYDYMSLNSRGDGILMGGAGEGYTFGINYHVNSNVKIMLNYAYMNHDRYANGKGKLFVGYDESGTLTKDPKKVVDAQGKAGDDFSMICVRFEVDF